MTDLTSNNFFRHVQDSLRQDPKKAGILAVLVLLLAFMIWRTFFSAAGGAPSAANAATAGSGTGGGETTANTGGTSGNNGVRSLTPGGQRDQSLVARWLASSPPPPLGRNLFAVKLDLFPMDSTKSQQAAVAGRGFWDEIAKSLLDRADQQERRQEQLAELQRQARSLQVTSLLMGPNPRAVINGELVGEGDVVAEFRVLKIEARRIVIEREGIRLEITMN